MLERALIGLFGTSAASLLVVTAASMAMGAQFELLLTFQGNGPWVYLALCGAGTGLVLLMARPLQAWRATLGMNAALLLALPLMKAWALDRNGVAAGVLHHAGDRSMALACLVLADLLIWLALALGENHARRAPSVSRGTPLARPSVPAATRIATILRLYPPFLLSAAVFADGFRLAHITPKDPLAGAGALGMLLAFFVLLPAASIRAWFPRSAAACFAIAAATYCWLLAIAWNPLWLAFACAALWLTWQNGIMRPVRSHIVHLSEVT